MDPFTVLVPYRNGQVTLGRLLDSLPEWQPVIVVDDYSNPPLVLTAEQRRRWPRVQVMRLSARRYFSGAVNAGMAACAGDALILNQDMELEGETWLSWLADAQGKYAIMGTGQMRHPAWPAGYVQGQFMYLARKAWQAVGGFNERDYPLWGGTAEWQVRACRRGYKALPVPSLPGVNHLRPQGESFGASIAETLADEPERHDLLVRTPPLVSVIITSYVYGRYLPDCINSLIGGPTSLGQMPGQTLQSFEAIIIDDGSRDETAEIGQALADPYKGIRYIRREHNGGTPAANNTGIRASYGRYLTILCADDMREPASLEALYRVVEADPRAVAYDDIYQFANGQRTVRQELGEYGFDGLVRKNMMHAGILFSRRAFDETGGYDERMREGREDWQFNVALGLKGYCGRKVQATGYLYRREGQNRSLGNSGADWGSAFRNQMAEIFPALYKGVKPMGCCGGGSTQDAFRSASHGFGQGGAAGMQAASAIGADGMVKLEYHGGNDADEPWYGPVTKARYLFGGKRTEGYVDARDAEGMLKMRDRGRTVFTLAPDEASAPLAGEAIADAFEPPMPMGATVREYAQLRTLAAGETVAADAIEPPIQHDTDSGQALAVEQVTSHVTPAATPEAPRKSAAKTASKPRAPRKTSAKKAANG